MPIWKAGAVPSPLPLTSSETPTPRLNANGTTTFNIYIMADDMENITNVNISVQALDETEGIIEQRDFEQVPIQDGWITSYTGTFFVTEPMTINFTVGNWNEFDDHPY